MIFAVDQETMKKNACQMPMSFLKIQRDLEKDNGHSLVLGLRRSSSQGDGELACVRSPFYSSRGGTRRVGRMN